MAVSTKPFATNYRIPIPTGYIVINGDQVAKIEAVRVLGPVGVPTGNWQIVFHLSDGNRHEIPPSEWTKNFVREVFEVGV